MNRHTIVWVNGTFGVGKTTVTRHLADLSGWPTFDPEHVGYMLAANYRDLSFDDFQDLPPWRTLVPTALHTVATHRGSNLIAPQSVLVESYWNELRSGMNERGSAVVHVVLDCAEDELRRRITEDEAEAQALTWRMDHVAVFAAARTWLLPAADLVIDTTKVAPQQIAEKILATVRSGA